MGGDIHICIFKYLCTLYRRIEGVGEGERKIKRIGSHRPPGTLVSVYIGGPDWPGDGASPVPVHQVRSARRRPLERRRFFERPVKRLKPLKPLEGRDFCCLSKFKSRTRCTYRVYFGQGLAERVDEAEAKGEE